jgi:hypothetical protein
MAGLTGVIVVVLVQELLSGEDKLHLVDIPLVVFLLLMRLEIVTVVFLVVSGLTSLQPNGVIVLPSVEMDLNGDSLTLVLVETLAYVLLLLL